MVININRNLKIILIALSVILICSVCLGCIGCYRLGLKHKTIIVHCDFETENNAENPDWKYKFLDKEKSDYIENLSKELKLDSDFVVAILMRENPEFNADAEHRNINGTCDLGLFQMNDKYIWANFVPSYWDMEIEFNPYNWKHNTFLALHHIQYLQEKLKVVDDVIAAYNCGEGAVMNENIPSSTVGYVAAVKNNYRLLKEMGENNNG